MVLFRSLVVLCLTHTSIAHTQVSETENAVEEVLLQEPAQEQIDQIFSRLTTDQKIGQLFLFGFVGTEYGTHLRGLIQKYSPGGIIFFGRNIKSAGQVLILNSRAQKDSFARTGVPMISAIDQEGGTVSRIRSQPPQPSALAIGSTESPDLSERTGYYTGRLLKSLGFNLNLAPVMDVADPKSPSFLGTRSFSGNVDAVGSIGLAFATGLHKAGIMSTLKHFPGHGNEKTDPHHKVPVIEDNLDTLENTRLKPFRHLIQEINPPAIMVGHLALPKVDPSAKAATYSKILIEDLLRAKWKYTGIVVTDDIDMAADDYKAAAGKQAVLALKSGVDMIMVAWNKRSQKASFEAVKKAVESGDLPKEKFEEKVKRILRVKLQFNLFDQESSQLRDVRLALNDPNLKKTFDDVTQINVKNHLLREPASLPRPKGKVLVLSRSHIFLQSFTNKLAPKCCLAKSLLEIEDINDVLTSTKDSLSIIHVSGQSTANIVNRIAAHLRKRVIIVNTNSPSLLMAPESYAKTFNVYTYHPQLGGLIAEKVVSPFTMTQSMKME